MFLTTRLLVKPRHILHNLFLIYFYFRHRVWGLNKDDKTRWNPYDEEETP